MGEMRNRREIAAEATQRVIVMAATRLFLENGYTGTSMGDVAREAGVAVQTIYNAVGSKRELLSRALDFAAAGDEAPTPVPVFMHERARHETDAREIVRQLVDFWRGGLARTAPVFAVIRQAAALDPEVATLETQRAQQRLRNYGQAASLMAGLGALRPGLSVDECGRHDLRRGPPGRLSLPDHGARLAAGGLGALGGGGAHGRSVTRALNLLPRAYPRTPRRSRAGRRRLKLLFMWSRSSSPMRLNTSAHERNDPYPCTTVLSTGWSSHSGWSSTSCA